MFDPLLLALTSGLSIFNHLKNNKHSEKLQAKQQEFARASVERNKQRMWELLREGQEITLQMEEEAHQARIQDINDDFDKVLHRLAYNQAINTWPLKVLPIVMKNQSLGTLLCGSNENVALHCILTPSNCSAFNNYVLSEVEDALTDFCNLHWSSLSAHPVLFYSGAWKSHTNPTGIEIQQLRTDLRNLPTLIITPYFKPDGGLVFQLNAWGIGNDVRADVECKDFSYADQYALGLDFKDDTDLRNTTIEELTSYLQCLIGYVADQYFWLMHNEAPILPSLLSLNNVSLDGKPYLKKNSEEHYANLLELCAAESKDLPFVSDKAIPLFEGSSTLFNDIERKKKLEEIFISYVKKLSGQDNLTMRAALSSNLFTKKDVHFVRKFRELYKYDDFASNLHELLDELEFMDFDYSILDSTDISYLKNLASDGNGAALFRLGELYEYSIGVDYDEDIFKEYYKSSLKAKFVFAYVRDGIINKNDSLTYFLRVIQGIPVVQSNIFLAKAHNIHIEGYDSIDTAMSLLDEYSENPHPYIPYLAAKIVKENFGIDQSALYEDLLIRSANSGYVMAQTELMECYMSGEYLDENPKKCYEYAQKAALQGHPDGLFAMALCLIKGYGTNANLSRGKDIMKMAAERGHSDAIEIINNLK